MTDLPDTFYIIGMDLGNVYTNADVWIVHQKGRRVNSWRSTGPTVATGMRIEISADELAERINGHCSVYGHHLHKPGFYNGLPARFLPICNNWDRRFYPPESSVKLRVMTEAYRKATRSIMIFNFRGENWEELIQNCAEFWRIGSLMSESFVAPLSSELRGEYGSLEGCFSADEVPKLKTSLMARLDVIIRAKISRYERNIKDTNHELKALRQRLGIHDRAADSGALEKAIKRAERRQRISTKAARQWFKLQSTLAKLSNNKTHEIAA